MTANILGLFAQAGTLAKSNAETGAAKSARVAGLVQDGYRRWFDGVTASVNDASRLATELGKVRSPADLAALHRDWLSTTQTRVTEGVQGFLDVSAKIAAEVSALPLPVKVPAAAPAPVTPKAEAPAAVPAPAPAPAPVVEAAPAPAPVVEAAAPAPEAPAAVVEPAPVAAPVVAPVVEEPAPAPVAEAAPAPAAPVAAEAVKPAAKAAPRRAAKTPTTKAASTVE